MNHWAVTELHLQARLPEILSSTDDARAIALDLKEGESLGEHEVHERAWVIVISGEVEASSSDGGVIGGGPGTLFEFAPGERRRIDGITDTRLLLILTPWPGDGHPGSMSLREKLYIRRRAAKARKETERLGVEA